MKYILILLLLLPAVYSTSILFWNLRTFGKGRATQEHGRELASISNGYDILLFAEVKDADCNLYEHCPIKDFFETYLPDYHLNLSPSLYYNIPFRNLGSEQYAILTRKNITVEMIEYPDEQATFIRRPFGIQLSNGVKILVFHSHPNKEIELIALANVFHYFGNKKIILMGDLNTGCHYVSFNHLDENSIRKDFDWLMADNQYTNFELNCPYDRIIATRDISPSCNDGIVLNMYNEAKRIESDHYPISIECNLFPTRVKIMNQKSNWIQKHLWLQYGLTFIMFISLPYLAFY
jgi:hypothetical protein